MHDTGYTTAGERVTPHVTGRMAAGEMAAEARHIAPCVACPYCVAGAAAGGRLAMETLDVRII
jgi:hypothetical protein